MEELKLLKDVERLSFNTQKELLTEMSKNTYLDIQKLVKDRKCTKMDFAIGSNINKDLDIQMVILKVDAVGDDWVDSDYLYYISRTTTSLSNVKKVVSDMAKYYKSNILKLED